MCNIKIHFFIMWLHVRPYLSTPMQIRPQMKPIRLPMMALHRSDLIRSDPIRSDQAVPAANIVLPKSSCRCYIADVIVAIFPCHADPTADESWCRTEPIRRR